jgi:simple sugar transport system permease protein
MTLPPSAVLPRGLGDFFGGFNINIGILIAIAAVGVMYVILHKTTLGYQLKAAGFNREASKFAGMNTKRDIILSMAIAGVLAGLAGAIIIMVPDKKMFMDQSTMSSEFMSIGFDGISIALLGLSEPIGIGLAGFFLAYIRQGGDYLELANYMKELADVITSVIIYFSALSVALYQFVQNRKKMKDDKPKKPLKVNIDTPNVDVDFNRNEVGDRELNVKVEPIPFIQKIKKIGKLLFGKA